MAQKGYLLSELLTPEEWNTPSIKPPAKDTGGFIDALQASGGRLIQGVGTGIEDYFGKGGVSSALQEYGKEVQANNPVEADLFSYKGIKELLGGSAIPLAGSLTGAAAGTAIAPGVGTILGGILGGIAGYQPIAYQNISDYQAQEGYTNPDAKLVGSIASAGIESAFGVQRKAIGAILTHAAKKLPKEVLDTTIAQLYKSAPRADGQSVFKYVLKELNKLGLIESGEEVAQAATERAFGGAPLTNADAVKDYATSAAGGYIGGVLLGGPFTRVPQTPKEQAEAQVKIDAQIAEEQAKAQQAQAAALEALRTANLPVLRPKTTPGPIENVMPANIEPVMKGAVDAEAYKKVLNDSIYEAKNRDQYALLEAEWNAQQPEALQQQALVAEQQKQALNTEAAHNAFLNAIEAVPPGEITSAQKTAVANVFAAANIYEKQHMPTKQIDMFGITDKEADTAIKGIVKGITRRSGFDFGLTAEEGKKFYSELVEVYKANKGDFLQAINNITRAVVQPPQIQAVPPGQSALFNTAGEPTLRAVQPTQAELDTRAHEVNTAFQQREAVTPLEQAYFAAQEKKQNSEQLAPYDGVLRRQGTLYPQAGQSIFTENVNGVQEEVQGEAAPEKDVNTVAMFGPKGGVTKAAKQAAAYTPTVKPVTLESTLATKADIEAIYGKSIPNWQRVTFRINEIAKSVTTAKEAQDAYESFMGTPKTALLLQTVLARRFPLQTNTTLTGPVVAPPTSLTPAPAGAASEAIAAAPIPTPAEVAEIAPAAPTPVEQPTTQKSTKLSAKLRTFASDKEVITNRVSYSEEGNKFERGAKVNATDALDSVDKDIKTLKQLLKCVGG